GAATTTIDNSTISNNSATGGAGGAGGGASFELATQIEFTDPITIRGLGSASLPGPTGNGGFAQGGGIYNALGARPTLVLALAVTISGNSATGGAGGAGGAGVAINFDVSADPPAGADGGDGGRGGIGQGGGIYNAGSLINYDATGPNPDQPDASLLFIL